MKKGKHIVSALAFAAIFVTIFLRLQDVFLPYWEGESDKYEVYYNLEENVIDIIFLGPSSNYFSVYPMELYVEHGIRSFNLGSPSQSLMVSYYQLLEACKTQKPKYCFIDMNSLFGMPGPEETHENQRYKMVVNMKPSKNKLELIRVSSETKEDVIGFLFPMYKFHTRWAELTALDFTGEDPAQEFRDAEYGATYGIGTTPYLGYHQYCDPPTIITRKSMKNCFPEMWQKKAFIN